MKYIMLQNYHPDWGTIVTHSVWIGDDELPIPNNSDFYLSDNIDKAEQYLSKLGFTKLKVIEFCIGGGL